ncbi:Hypothetical predicted protein [Lynx pardinus]|uniref:Coiled-coil domain-containing protein n=1 Tax=Lynx pardinus TaxID=191816 RepID=A0A485NWZ7_LYNPA|nr:Hypothetical predicted protein [Lynx pardinus]
MSTEFYFFKRAVRNRLEDNTFLPLWELVESWTQNDWMAIFFIIFLGIIFEIILIKIYTSFHKKPVLPEKGSSGAQEKEDCCLKSMKFDNWSIRSSSPSEERVDEFSVRTITSSLKTEDKEGNFEDRVSPTDEVIWSGTSESKYQVSYSSESRMPSSHGTSSSLSLFHSEVKEFFLSHRGYENEHETAQFSSRKLFAILKTNKNKNPAFSSDFNFSRCSSISRESEGLDMAPCPPAHLFLSRDQVRLLEETVRNQIPLKPKTILESKTTYPYSRPQESLIQNQHSFGMHIPTQAQDSFPVQNATQNQGFYEARFTSQAQQFVNNQESVNSQPDIMARYFALPQDLIRKPFSSSTQDSFQTQVLGRSQHLVNVPHSVETQHSIKGLESDNKHLHETQYSSVWFQDSNQIKHLTQGQNAIFKNARFLVLTVSPNSFAEGMLQIRSVKPEGQKQIASSELNQYSVYSSVPLSLTFERQKNWRKALHGKSKLSRKVSSQKSKKPPTPWVFQMTVCHTSKPGKLGCKHNAKKKELHPRKGVSDIALHLLYFSKLVPPYSKRYSRKKLVEVMPGVTGRRHSLLKQNKTLDAENVSCVGSVEKRGTSGNAKNVKQHGRENEGQKNISAKLPSWLEEPFMVNTFPLKAPCSLLIETNWKNKQSLKDPITQEKEIGIAEFHAPNSKKTSDLHIPKHESPLEEAISERWQKFASSPEMESNRRMKTREDLKSTENSHLPLSNGEELPTNSPETQRCFPNRNIQKERDFLEIVLETSEVNLLISLGTKEHKSSEQVASVKTQESTEETVMKEKKPLILHVTEYDDPSESERLQCNTRSHINMQDKRIFATFHNATDTTISGPPDTEMRSRLKAKTDTSTTGFSYSVVEQEKLPDEKKASDAKYIEERCIKKPQEHDREEEEPTLQEAVPQLKQDFRVSLQLKQKPKYVRFEIKQSSSGSRKNPNKEQEVQPQTLSTETIVGTGPCPTMDPFQVQVKQITDRPTGRETADAKNPLTVLENSPVGGVITDTTERDVPFGGSPRKIPDDHIAEEKEDLKRVFPAAALGLFIIRTLPLSSFKRQKIRRKWSGAKTVLGPKLVIMKVKKPANLLMPNISRNGIPSLRRRLRGNFKIITKQILQDKIVSDVLVNVTYPHMSTVPRIRTHSRLNAENPSHTKPNQEESEDEREEKHSNFINKGNDPGNTLEEAKLQDEVRGDEAARPEAVLHGPWHLRLNANPEKEFRTEEEMPQPVTSGESLVESVDTPIMDLFHVENMKKSLATQADLKHTADAEIPLPTSGKSVIGDPINQTRESDVLDYGNDTREMGYFFADTKAELPKDLPAMYSETFNCHMPVLTHSKVNKNRVRFSHTECPVKPKSVPTNTVKPSVSQVFNSTGHRKKLDSEAKAKLEKINQANGLVYDFISSLFSPMHSRLQGETNSFCHAQLKQGQLAEEVRPRYVDFFDKCSAFHDQEEKVKDGEEVEQKTLLEAASQHTQHLWPDACQAKETHLDEQYTALSSLTQEQDAQHQKWFAQTALQTSLQMAPREGEELEKPSQTEHAITAPMGAESPPPKAENSSFDNIFNTMTESPENSQSFIFNAYQKENFDLVQSDEELKQPQSRNLQVQPQIHGTQTVLSSASCPILDQLQFGELESYAGFSPPKSEEVKNDEIIFSAREHGVPSDANHQKEQAGGVEKKDTVTFDSCLPALSTPQTNFKYSDKKTSVNIKYGLLKAKKLSVSNIFNIKGAVSPNHRKELGCNPTTKMKEVHHGEKMAAKMYSFMTITPDINTYNKIEREKDMLGERSLRAKQVKQATSPLEGNITSDDTKENSVQDEEEETGDQEILKVISQHSTHFKFCSGQREELDLHQSENQGSGKILFVIEQDIPQQMQPTDSMLGEKPKKSHHPQNGAIYIASSKLPPLKSKDSLIGQVLVDTVKGGVPSVGSHMGELYHHGKEENAEFKKNLEATVLEYSERRKSPCDREAWNQASSTDMQNRSSKTMKMNVQHEKEEENIQRMLLDSVPHCGQHHRFSADQMKNPGSSQSTSELNHSEVRRTWNLPWTAQKMRQEECFRETVSEPVSRHMMTFLQVETEKKGLSTQEGIKCMERVKTPLPKARKSETASIKCGTLWDGNPRRRWDSPILGKKAWNQNDLVRTVLKPSDFSSLDSSVPKSQSYALEFVSKRSIVSSKHVTLKAKKRPSSQLLNTIRCITGSHRKKKECTFQYKMKRRQWIESVVEASLPAVEGTEIPPSKIVTDKHSFNTIARSTIYNRTLHKNLRGHTTEEKAELEENSATTFLGPLDFFTPILSDPESQKNTVQLLEEKITLNINCSIMKKKELAISQIPKIRRQFTTKYRNKPGSNLKTKMKQMRQDKNVANTFPNTIDFTPDTPDLRRQSRLKTGIDRGSQFRHTQPTHRELPTEGLVISQPLHATSRAALSNNERQEKKIGTKGEKTVLRVDLKSVYDSMPIFSHIKMEPSPSTWGISEESSEKGNALNKGKEEKQPECIHQISPKPASHSLRDIFQSKMPCKEKASKEVVSTMDYIPSTEQIGSFITRQDSKVRIGKGKPCMKLTSLCASLPSLPHTDVNSRIKVGQGKSGILKSCLLPLKSQVSSSVRKTLFAKSINRDSLSRVIESKHLPQGKKEDGENIVYVKDIMGLKCVTFKGKKTSFKYILHGKEPQWNNKEQEEMMQKDKSDLDMVQNKHHASFPSSPHLERMPGIKEVLMRGIAGFCLPSLTLKELSDAMGVREEPTDDILSSIKKAKYMPRRDRVEMALEEIMQPKRIALKVKQSPITQELQLNIKENEKNIQEHKDNQVGIRNTSCISVSFPSYSEVDIRITGEETRLIKRRSSFLQPELQESSDIEKIAYKESVYGDISSSINKAKEYIMQEEEERVKKEEVIPFREKKSPISQETQLDIEEQETKVQKIKDEPNVLVSNTSPCIIAPSHLKLGTRIKTADSLTEVARYCIPELSRQKSSDAVKKANKESIDDHAASDVQEAKDYVPQKEEGDVEISAERDVMHPKDKDLKRKQALSQDIPPDLKEQVNVDLESEEQGRMEGGGKGEREVVLPTHGASESSLSHHELDTRIEGEEDSQGITRPAVSQLLLQKSFEAGKTAYTKSTGDDISKDLRVVQEYEPEKGEDGRKIVNMKYLMYPKGTTSKEKVLLPPHVLYTSGSCGSQIVEVQTNMKEKLGNRQERSKLDKLLTRTSLLPFKLNKGIGGKEEKEGVTRPSLPPSWHKESSHAEELKYTVPPLNGIASSSKRTEYMTQTEEEKANTFEEDIMHPRYIALRAKKSPLFLILKTKKLQVNIKEQGEVGQEDNEDTVVLLSRIHPFITSSTHLKWDTIKDEEGEPGIIRNDVPHLELQESLPSGRVAPTESSDSHVIKEEQHPRQEERNRVQTEATDGSMRPSGTDCKAKISPPPPVFRVTEHSALNNIKEPQWSMMEKVEQEQQRTGDPDVARTKTPPSTPSPPHHRCSPSQLLCPESSDAGKTRHADSNEGIGSFDVTIKINQPMPYTKVKNRVNIKDGEGRRFPKIITLRAEISSPLHLSSRKRLPLYIKEQGKEVQEGKSEPEMVLKEVCASLPSPSCLKWDGQMNEKEDTLEKTHFTFPPSKIQDPSNSGKEAYTKSFYGELKEKDRLKIDIEDKMVPRCMALKAKEVPLSHILDTKKLQWKMKEQERKMQKKKNDLVENLGNICTSLLTLPYLKFGKTEGEGYMIRITNVPLPQLQSKESLDAVKTAYAETTDGELSNDVKELKEHTLQKEVRDGEKNVEMNSTVAPSDRHLKEKRSPILLRYNLSDHPWKTKDQEGMAQEGQREPGGTIPTKTCTCTCRSSPLHLYKNPRCEKKRMAILTRSSLSPVNFQESSDSEDVESVEPTARDILISPQKGKDQMPQNKEGGEVETVNLVFPKHQEKKIQGSKNEPGVVLANTSSPSSSLPLLQLDKEIQVDDEMLVATRSVVQRVSNAREIVHTEAIGGDVLQDSQNAKQCMPQEEEQDREKTNMKSMAHITDIILKSKKSPPSRMLHRTELHLIIGGQEPKKHEGQGKPPCTVLRKIYVSRHSANPTLDKGTQVNEKMLGIRRPYLLPCVLSALSGAGAIRDVRERKQHMSQKEKKYEVKTVDMRIRMHHKEARISSISRIFNTKEFVLNIKEQKENMCKGEDELPIVLTRTFLSIPSAPALYLDSGNKIDKDVPGATGSSPLQQNLQESSDTQKTAITEVVAGDSEIVVKKVKHSVPQEETVQQWTSNFMVSVQRRNEPPRVKSEGDLSLLVLNSQHEDIYLTGFGTISGKRLEYFFTGQEARPEKYKTETFTTFLSYPTKDPAKMANLKKETEIMDDLNHKRSPKSLVSPPRKISKEIYVTFGTPVRAKGFSVSEQDAPQQKTLSKASPGSGNSYTSDKPEKEVQNHDKMSKMPSSKALALQTKGLLEKMNITESDTPPIIEEQEIVVKKQVVLQSERGHKTCLDSSLCLKLPLKDGRQKTQLETDVCKQTMVYPRIQILPGTHVDITVFDTLGGKKEQALLVPEQKECILESCQKPLPFHWTFPAQSEDLEGKNKMDTSAIINLEQTTLELEEGELKIDTNIAICLEKDKTEMHKHIIVSLEENLKRDTNNVVNGNTPSPKAEESQINTQVITRIGNSCPIKQKHKKDLEVPGAKQNIQPRKMFQKHILDSFYAYIPLSIKFEGRKGRLTIADLKRELSPKYLTMKTPNHPISQILNNTGRGIPSNRKKLEYDFSGPKKTVLWREDTSGICIRSLSISTVNSSQTEETAESETNLEREKILCLSEFQQKSPSTGDVKRNSSSIVKEGCPPFPPLSKSETNLSHEAKENILISQTKEENVVPGPDSSRIIKEPYLLMTEKEEKAPKPILTPTECPLMSDDPKDSVETHMEKQGDQSEPIQDTTTPKVQQQKTFPGSGPVPSQVKSNEIKVVAERTSAESLLPLYEAVKNILESQIKNMIQDKICEDILEKIKAHKPDAWKSPSFAGSSDTTSTTKPPKLQPKLILERLLPKENNKLTNHLESKAFEIKLNLIPEIAKKSFHNFNFYLKQSISEHNSWRLYPRHKKMCFLSLEGIDATEPNLNQKYPKDSPPVRCMKTLIVNVSSDGKEIIANRKSIRKLESVASSATSANEMPLTPILPNYSAEEKDKLFVHFSIKTLEIQMTAFPRIVRESYTMANAQNTKKPLSKFVNSGTKVPKRKNKILLLFEEKSLHQIDLNLQYKYLHFLLGLPVKSMFPKPNALPKHILKLNTVAICKNRDYRGESGGGLCIDTEPLVQHISSKKQSPHENSSLMKKFLKPTHVCASNADQQATAQKDSTVLSELKSHVTPEKDKQCHGWFQETNTYKYFDPKTQESAPHLVDSHSIPISEDSADSQTNIESLANLEACSALEVYGSKECMFLEANPYLSQESQNILFELQKGIPLENLYKMRKSKTNLKPFYREYSGSHHGVRGCRKHSSIVTPSYESHKSRKYGSSDTTPFPDWLCYGSLNTVDIPSSSSSVAFSEGKSSWSAGHRTTYSLAPLTESNIKLHLAKSQGKPYSHLESKERKKAKLDLFRKNNLHWDCDYSYTQNKEKCTRKKKVCNYESERLNHYASKPKLPSKPHREDVYFHSESKQNQPFFYACMPADSLEIMPQTIRWTIPPRTLKKTNFRVPLVAKISSSCNIWTSSKKLLGSLLESFSPVHPNGYNHI